MWLGQSRFSVLSGLTLTRAGSATPSWMNSTTSAFPRVEGVFFTDAEKENMLNSVKLLMEKKRLKIAGDDKALIAQLNEQEYAYLQPKTAQERIHLKFWHPIGKHDDQLMALALACKAAESAAPPGVGAFIL